MARATSIRSKRNGRRSAILIMTAASLLAAGCSSSSSSSATANKADMTSVMLRASDLPNGWTSTGKSNPSDKATRAIASKIRVCQDFVAQSDLEKSQLKTSSADWRGPANSIGQRGSISNQVVGYASENLAKTAYGVFASDSTEACLNKTFEVALNQALGQIGQPQGSNPSIKSNVTRLGVSPAGDATTAYQVSVTLQMSGQTENVGFLIQIVRLGPYVVTYNGTLYESAGEHFGRNLVDRSMARLEAASGISGQGG